MLDAMSNPLPSSDPEGDIVDKLLDALVANPQAEMLLNAHLENLLAELEPGAESMHEIVTGRRTIVLDNNAGKWLAKKLCGVVMTLLILRRKNDRDEAKADKERADAGDPRRADDDDGRGARGVGAPDRGDGEKAGRAAEGSGG